MTQHLHRMKEKIQETKGVMAIEIVIGMLMFTLILSFLVDISILTWKFNVASQTSTHIARNVGLQGGLLASTPYQFPGGDAQYTNQSEMQQYVKKNMNQAGIEDGDYRYRLSRTTAKYGQPITVTVDIEYSWELLSNFIPGNLNQTVTSKRTAISEYQPRLKEFGGN